MTILTPPVAMSVRRGHPRSSIAVKSLSLSLIFSWLSARMQFLPPINMSVSQNEMAINTTHFWLCDCAHRIDGKEERKKKQNNGIQWHWQLSISSRANSQVTVTVLLWFCLIHFLGNDRFGSEQISARLIYDTNLFWWSIETVSSWKQTERIFIILAFFASTFYIK